MQKEKLIFIYPKLFTFIQTEISLLSDNYELIYKTQNWKNKLLLPFNLISSVIFPAFKFKENKHCLSIIWRILVIPTFIAWQTI